MQQLPSISTGPAITVLPKSALRPWQRLLGSKDGLPSLPPCRIGFITAPGEHAPEVKALGETIRAALEAPVPDEAEPERRSAA